VRLGTVRDVTHDLPTTEQDLRAQALRSLKKKRDFRSHLVAYVLVNALLIGIWAVTGAGFFWPVFPLLGWGIAVGFNAWDVFGRRPITEEEILREQERLRRSA
jgi:2TM domain-containing protein